MALSPVLVACALLLAAGVPAAPAGRPPLQGVPPSTRGPGSSWGHQQPVPHPGDTSGEFSGDGNADGERWGDASPTRGSRPLGAVTRVPVTPGPRGAGDSLQALGTVAAPASAGTGAWRDSGPTLEEPLVTWRGREAEGRASPWMETRGPLAVPTDTGRRSPGLAEPGHGVAFAGTPSPQPTVSTIALRPVTATTAQAGPTGAPAGPPRSVPVSPTAVPGSAPGPPFWAPSGSLEGRAETWTMELPARQRSTRRAPVANATSGHVALRTVATPRTAAAPRTTIAPHTTITPHTIITPRTTIAPRTAAAPRTTTAPAAPAPALATSPAAPTASGTAAPRTPRAGMAPEEELGSPQRVRGALVPPNATAVAVPALRTPGPRRSDTTRMQPPGPSTAHPSSTQRWGPVRVTTQRALPHPAAPEREPNATPAAPEPFVPCPPDGEPCGALRGNGTGPRWAEVPRALRFAWDAQLYGAAALFVLLSTGCAGALLCAPALRPPQLPHVLLALGLLLAVGVARAIFLLLDPYGARGRLPRGAALLLATAPFPLLLAAFAVMLQRLQRRAQLVLLPPPLRGLPALAAAAALPTAALATADLLAPRLGPAPGLALHALGCAAGALLLLAGLRGCWRVLRGPGAGGHSEAPALRRGARALAAAAALGLPCCGLQLYSALWLWGALGPSGHLSWPCWAAQLCLRGCELAVALALLAAAAEPLCCHQPRGDAGATGAADHSCWAKALRYFCTARKAAAPEYPNNCYDWAGAGAERAPASDISKSLIRNAAEQLPLRALKDSNEAWAAAGAAPPAPGLSPKCPNAAAVAARSFGSLCLERGSTPSLGELAFRPPSPIDLRRSIDQALCRQHLLREGLFARPRRGSSGASLRPGALPRCSSLTELPRAPAAAVAAATSASSLESSSLHISWNPWRHGLSSPESLPPDEAPSRAPLLARPVAAAAAAPRAPDSEREARRSFLALSKQVDSRSLSSDTIEL